MELYRKTTYIYKIIKFHGYSHAQIHLKQIIFTLNLICKFLKVLTFIQFNLHRKYTTYNIYIQRTKNAIVQLIH